MGSGKHLPVVQLYPRIKYWLHSHVLFPCPESPTTVCDCYLVFFWVWDGGHPICVQCVNRFSSNLGNYFKCKKGNGMSDVSNAFLKTCSLRVVLSNSIIFQFSIFIWWLQIKFIWLCYINIVDDDKPRLSKRLGEKVSQVGVWAAGRIWSDIHSKCERTDSACYCKELDKPIGQNLDRNPSTPPSSPSTRLLKSL